ncbi:MAG: hypothetical protein MI975_23150 [Cytophagales bacterium]|nr:hypothetical protein [Cytophagales bacterium]
MQEYVNVDRKLHLLCQVLAKIAANLIEETEDYSHTNLGFDPIGRRIFTRWINSEKGDISLCVDLNRFSFQWIDHGLRVKKEIPISGKTYGQLESELEFSASEFGYGPELYKKPLKYEIEDYPFKEAIYRSLPKDGLNDWIKFRSSANTACEHLLEHLNATAEIRIWPHHFDTGIYTVLSGKLGVGFGLAVQDSMVNAPYFYLSGYPLDGGLKMENLPKLKDGYWETGAWKGAVLPLNILYDQEDTYAVIDNFILSSFSWYQQTIL